MSEADEKAKEDRVSPEAEDRVPTEDEEKVREGGVTPKAEEKVGDGVVPQESQDELTTDYETDRPPTGLR